MKSVEMLAVVVALVIMTCFGVWLGAGLGLVYCADVGDQGYSHLILRDSVRAYCEIREAKQ